MTQNQPKAALSDDQSQLMLLEQQNKKNLSTAAQQRDAHATLPSTLSISIDSSVDGGEEVSIEPGKTAMQALPSLRLHTTNQLTAEEDEYIPREIDEAGEQKVSPTGEPLGNRQFKVRTFYVAHRGEKRFMLATECARVLGYEDSYLLFNKYR